MGGGAYVGGQGGVTYGSPGGAYAGALSGGGGGVYGSGPANFIGHSYVAPPPSTHSFSDIDMPSSGHKDEQ